MVGLRSLADSLEIEEKAVASYGSVSSRSRGRRHKETARQEDVRSPYQHDRDRILHSVAFRRLQHKTQVYVFHEGDFYRTRLTHSIEVAQISRGLANLLGANEDLAEAIALAHDVGHPPFGHAGETALNRLMAEQGGFEHNLQALRTVDDLEVRYPGFQGLNLTWETREGIAKHSTPFDSPKPNPEFDEFEFPGLEAQIVNLADVIAYCTHDLEDALLLEIVREGDLAEVELWTHSREKFEGDTQVGVRTTIRHMISNLMMDAAAQTSNCLKEIDAATPDDVRKQRVATFSPRAARLVQDLLKFLKAHVYYDPRVLRMTYKGEQILERLWNAFTDESDRAGVRLLPLRTQQRISSEQDKNRVICDFMAGMTDRHAMDLYNVLFNAYEPSLQTFS